MRLRAVLALVVPLLFAALALARGSGPPITVHVQATVAPNQAGTPAHPRGVRLGVRVRISMPPNSTPPLLKEIDVWFPRGGLYNGDRYPACTKRILDATGPSGCPTQSIMGHGSGVARADRSYTYPKITVVNGGQREVFFYTVLNNPARVQQPVVGKVTKLSGRWSYKLTTVIPRDLQVVAGVPIVLRSLHIAAGRGDWLSTTYCPPDRRWAWRAVGIFTDGQIVKTHGAVACRP